VTALKAVTSPVESEPNIAIAASGGLWAADRDADRKAVVVEARERGIRAFSVQGNVDFIAELPELEFLVAMDPPDVRPIHALPRLRLLSLSGTWGGRLDGSAWPRLEWFSAVETPKDEGGVETLLSGQPGLRSLGVGRYRRADFVGVRGPRLESLAIWDSRALTSLAGIGSLGGTLTALNLAMLPNLSSLDGIESLPLLEVVKLDGIRQVTTLDAVARLPHLRFLDIMDLKTVASLWPLAGHPTLEYVSFGPTRDLDLDPLLEIPNLKLVLTGSHRWNRDVHGLPYWHDCPPDDPRRLEWNRLTLR
jgi:hypothetical protein